MADMKARKGEVHLKIIIGDWNYKIFKKEINTKKTSDITSKWKHM
jgi:hypothetical protein